MKTVADVLEMAQSGQDGGPAVHRHARHLAAFHHPGRGELTEELFEEGIGFDGSSIRGFKEIHESDMLLMPDPNTAFIDPIFEVPDAGRSSATCTIRSPAQPYTPRPALHRQEGRGLPEADRHRRHQLLGARGRVLHL